MLKNWHPSTFTIFAFEVSHFVLGENKKISFICIKFRFMTLNDRIELLSLLGKHLLKFDDPLKGTILRTYHGNRWFTEENIEQSISAIANHFLDKEKLTNWINRYNFSEPQAPKNVGLVMAGNIPMVGFHDWLCTFVSGHHAQIKLSEKDKFLLPYAVNFLSEIEPKVNNTNVFSERLKELEAVIATGSNNSSRYFEAYFGKYPNIIRKNRTSIAVLSGNESEEELMELGKDIFHYFGLGCRNVSKIYVPKDFDFQNFMKTMHEFKEIIHHHKYKNNFDYNFSLLILNKIKHYSNGCLLVHESEILHSRITSLHYEFYESTEQVITNIRTQLDEIQCIVSSLSDDQLPFIPLGSSQEPGLSDYADNIDTFQFLIDL